MRMGRESVSLNFRYVIALVVLLALLALFLFSFAPMAVDLGRGCLYQGATGPQETARKFMETVERGRSGHVLQESSVVDKDSHYHLSNGTEKITVVVDKANCVVEYEVTGGH